MPLGTQRSSTTAAGKAQKISVSAALSNLSRNAVTSLATITTPASAPTTTGFTDLTPASTGFVANFTGNTSAGSMVITGVSSTSSLVVGMPLVENTSVAVYPANIPLGALITAIGSGTVTISRAATGTATGITLHAASDLYTILGGVAASYNGNFAVSGQTIGNAVNPPTALNVGYNGYAIGFFTDAANFSTGAASIILVLYQNGASPNSFRVAIDDVYQTSSPTAFGSTGAQWITIQFSSAGTHKVRIELSALVLGQHFYVMTGASVWKPKSAYPVQAAFYGDSFFAAGASGSWAGRNIANQVAQQLGWSADLCAQGGTGYVSNGSTNYNFASPYRTADITRKSYDVIVMLGSVNDSGQTASAIQTNALSTFQQLRANAANATIFVFGCPTTVSVSSATATTIENAVSAAFTQWGDANAYFIPITTDPDGNWITSSNTSIYIASDNTHPTDPAGTGYYATRMAQKINALLSTVSA